MVDFTGVPNPPLMSSTGQTPYVPTGYEMLDAQAAQKHAIANALLSESFSNTTPGWGGVMAKLGDAVAGKIVSNKAGKLEQNVLTQKMQGYQDSIAKVAAALQPGADPNTMRDAAFEIARNPMLANSEIGKTVMAGYGELLKNNVTFGDKPISVVGPGGVKTDQLLSKGGSMKSFLPAGSSVAPEISNVNGVAVALQDQKPGSVLPADPTALVNHAGAPNSSFVPNPTAITAKLQATPPLFGGAVDPNTGNFIQQNRHTGEVTIPEMGVPAIGGAARSSVAPLNQIASIVPQLFPGARVTSGIRTPAEQAALQASGATTAGNNSAHVRGNGLDLSANAANNAVEIKAKFEAAGYPVSRVIDERASGMGTGPHWHVKFAGTPGQTVREAQQAPGQNDVSRTLGEIKQKYDQLQTMNAIPQENQGGLEYVGHKMAAKYDPGLISPQAQSLRSQIVAFRRPLAQNIAKAAGMSAKQMDSNVELQSWLDSLSDPSQSYEANMAILNHVNENYGTPARARASMLRLGINPQGTSPSLTSKPLTRSKADILKQYGL